MILFDRVIRKAAENYREALLSSIKIKADNVASYFFEGTPKEYWAIGEDFPNLAPPFETFWIEAKHPKSIVSEETGTQSWIPDLMGYGWGCLFTGSDIPQDAEWRERFIEGLPKMRRMVEESFEKIISRMNELGINQPTTQEEWEKLKPNLPKVLLDSMTATVGTKRVIDNYDRTGIIPAHSDAKWSLQAFLWIDCGKGTDLSTPVLGFNFMIAPDGKPLPMNSNGSHNTAFCTRESDWKDLTQLMQACSPRMQSLLLAICFMHCANVQRIDKSPNKKEDRLWSKTNLPLSKYYVLEIEQIKKAIAGANDTGDESGFRRALHICRGHFAHYLPERPLFGKVSGTFWKPQHSRGTAEQGVIHKDYDVKT